MTDVILHEFEEDECEKNFDTKVMNCNTLTQGRVLIIDIVALKAKNEICEQNYAAHATYSTKVRRKNLLKNFDTTQKWDNTTPNGDRIKTNRGSIGESKTQYSVFFFDVIDK